VDDILTAHYSSQTNIDSILADFNNIHPKLHFMLETEINNTINYSDIYKHRSQRDLTFPIHRKPTFMNAIIPCNTCHLLQHKYAVVRYPYIWIHTYHLSKDAETQQINIIHNIFDNKAFPMFVTNITRIKTNSATSPYQT
jgi:hypothetical protein